LRDVEDPTFSEIQLTDGGKVVSPTRRPLFTIVRLEGLGKLKKKSILSGTRTGDLLACSIVPQPTTLPRAPIFLFSTASRSTLRLTQPRIQWQQGVLIQGVKRQKGEADHFHPVSTSRMVELYLHYPTRLHGVVFN
jgi:hypothetical protein